MIPNYRIDYHTNGKPRLFEFYLFINPLGRKCFQAELEVEKALNRIEAKTDLHIISYTNQGLIEQYLYQFKIANSDIETRNQLFCTVYQTALAYKAATLQGKKKGRLFLRNIQQCVASDLSQYCPELIQSVAQDSQLDMAIFNEDRQSDYVKQLYLQDQQIANEMGVLYTPSLVIFDSCMGKEGLIIDSHITTDIILDHLDTMVENCHALPNHPCSRLSIFK